MKEVEVCGLVNDENAVCFSSEWNKMKALFNSS